MVPLGRNDYRQKRRLTRMALQQTRQQQTLARCYPTRLQWPHPPMRTARSQRVRKENEKPGEFRYSLRVRTEC